MTSDPSSPAATPSTRRVLSATEVVKRLSQLVGWRLSGDGPDLAIEKTYAFRNYYETLAFVNAVAFQAHAQDHHPVLTVHYDQCQVRFSTHVPRGLTSADFEGAAQIDTLIPAPKARHD